jgi:hypothetical protein
MPVEVMLWEGDPPGVYRNDVHRCRKRARCDTCGVAHEGARSYDSAIKVAQEQGWQFLTIGGPYRCLSICPECACSLTITKMMEKLR